MQIFSVAGLRRLDEIVQPGLLCVFDFDGTLSPIVSQPDDAGLPADVLQRILELLKLAPVAILTGRSLADIRTRLGFEPDYVVGNHGLEGVPGWEWRATQFEDVCRSWSAAILAALQDKARFDPGITLEDKKFSLSVHYRMARDPVQAEARLAELFAGLMPPPRVISGKFVFSLLPKDGIDKGSALQELLRISGASSVIYVGDDVTDEDVFRLQRRDLLSVRVEKSHASAAEFYLARWQDIVSLLDELIRRLRETEGNAAPRASARKA
ncbi:MAG: otsB [Herminiimonas sp.]|nr:otsB [Herminiimonas sp.]